LTTPRGANPLQALTRGTGQWGSAAPGGCRSSAAAVAACCTSACGWRGLARDLLLTLLLRRRSIGSRHDPLLHWTYPALRMWPLVAHGRSARIPGLSDRRSGRGIRGRPPAEARLLRAVLPACSRTARAPAPDRRRLREMLVDSAPAAREQAGPGLQAPSPERRPSACCRLSSIAQRVDADRDRAGALLS